MMVPNRVGERAPVFTYECEKCGHTMKKTLKRALTRRQHKQR